jgi:hypothetical protein
MGVYEWPHQIPTKAPMLASRNMPPSKIGLWSSSGPTQTWVHFMQQHPTRDATESLQPLVDYDLLILGVVFRMAFTHRPSTESNPNTLIQLLSEIGFVVGAIELLKRAIGAVE